MEWTGSVSSPKSSFSTVTASSAILAEVTAPSCSDAVDTLATETTLSEEEEEEEEEVEVEPASAMFTAPPPLPAGSLVSDDAVPVDAATPVAPTPLLDGAVAVVPEPPELLCDKGGGGRGETCA